MTIAGCGRVEVSLANHKKAAHIDCTFAPTLFLTHEDTVIVKDNGEFDLKRMFNVCCTYQTSR